MNFAPFTLAMLAWAAAVTAAPPSSTGVPGPTVAVEDTMHTAVPEVLIRAPRVTLAEILDRVARGEARRDSLIRDQTFRATIRLVSNTTDPRRPPELESETVMRVYKKRPSQARTVMLRRWQRKPPKKEDARGAVNVRFRSDTSEEIVNRCVEANSFEALSGRERGSEDYTLGWRKRRKGIAGDWTNVFTERDKEIFKEEAGELLVELGYEKDHNW